MIQIDIDMPTDCVSCWIRQNMGCKIANESGWLNNRRDDKCPLKEQKEVVRCKDCKWWDKKDDSNYGYCHACKHGYHSDHWEIGIYRTYKSNWFCADGERKEGR